jgi:NAD(P)H dehydrogenase (quinone)
MNVLLVYAHEDPASFIASLHNIAQEVLVGAGHTVVSSDLYGVGFNPVAQKIDFTTTSGKHYNYMNEQAYAASKGLAYSVDIVGELQKLQNADLVLFYFPLWWNAPPAILKGWFDRVLTMGTAWDGEHMFSTGKYRGKQAGVVVSVGEPETYYRPDGIQKATVPQMLYPVLHGTLAFCGFDVLAPTIMYGLNVVTEFTRADYQEDHRSQLEEIFTNPRFLYRFA